MVLQASATSRNAEGFSLSPTYEKHSGLSTDVCSQNCCSCLDANNLICDQGMRCRVNFSMGRSVFLHSAL
ncbi:hypothetical protein YC2023_041100 [Brassica napus]